ncbi:MAG: DUF642 domain-containing protein [Okeania sp. SIO3H1]|nr:DUF642 domain-containing protein [Okeania sp. SIO3H1]
MKQILSWLMSALLTFSCWNFMPSVTSVAIAATDCSGTVIFEDSFDEDPLKLGNSSLTHWDVEKAIADLQGQDEPKNPNQNGYNLYGYYGLGHYLDLSGGGISTINTKKTFILTPGTYQLSFEIGGSPGYISRYAVEVGNIFHEDFLVDGDDRIFSTISRQIKVDTDTNAWLSFINSGPNGTYGPILNKVSFNKLPDSSICPPPNQSNLCCDATSVEPEVIFKETFDQEPLKITVNNLANWKVGSLKVSANGGFIDVIGQKEDGAPLYDYYGPGTYIDLSGGGISTISTKEKFTLTPGIYELSFEMGGTPKSYLSTYTVQLGDVFDEKFIADGQKEEFVTVKRQIKVEKETNAWLSFINYGPNATYGPILNQVSLSKIATCNGGEVEKENLVENGSFEEPELEGFYSFEESIPGWEKVQGYAIEINKRPITAPKDGSQVVELDSYSTTKIAQDITTEVGKTYTLSFAFKANPNASENKLNVYWGDTVVANLNKTATETEWQTYTYDNLKATSTTTTLSFDNLDEISDSAGTYIDAVSVLEN